MYVWYSSFSMYTAKHFYDKIRDMHLYNKLSRSKFLLLLNTWHVTVGKADLMFKNSPTSDVSNTSVTFEMCTNQCNKLQNRTWLHDLKHRVQVYQKNRLTFIWTFIYIANQIRKEWRVDRRFTVKLDMRITHRDSTI